MKLSNYSRAKSGPKNWIGKQWSRSSLQNVLALKNTEFVLLDGTRTAITGGNVMAVPHPTTSHQQQNRGLGLKIILGPN